MNPAQAAAKTGTAVVRLPARHLFHRPSTAKAQT